MYYKALSCYRSKKERLQNGNNGNKPEYRKELEK